MFIPVFSTFIFCGNISLELEVNPTLSDALIFTFTENWDVKSEIEILYSALK